MKASTQRVYIALALSGASKTAARRSAKWMVRDVAEHYGVSAKAASKLLEKKLSEPQVDSGFWEEMVDDVFMSDLTPLGLPYLTKDK